jgi:hypothetical protein
MASTYSVAYSSIGLAFSTATFVRDRDTPSEKVADSECISFRCRSPSGFSSRMSCPF